MMTEEDDMAKTETKTSKLAELSKRWGVDAKTLGKLEESMRREDAAPLVRGVGADPTAHDGEGEGELVEAVLAALVKLDLDFGTRINTLRRMTDDLVLASVAHGIVKRHLLQRKVGRG